jgi:hypothetical protein
MDQGPLFNNVGAGGAIPGVAAWMCPGRGRPSNITPSSGATFLSTGAVGTPITSAPPTDYIINCYLNDNLLGALNAIDNKRTLVGVTDGTSNTVFFGHGQINQGEYSLTTPTNGRDDALHGGGFGTGLSPIAAVTVVFQRDPAGVAAVTNRMFGSPFSQGCLMGMADGTVRMFPYSMGAGTVSAAGVASTTSVLAAFLTPTGNETVTLPDT